MHIKFSPFVDKEITKIKQKNKKLANRIEKQLALFSSNPNHPSLRLHKISDSAKDVWSISITMSIRMLCILLNENSAYFFDIGKHEEIYRK